MQVSGCQTGFGAGLEESRKKPMESCNIWRKLLIMQCLIIWAKHS
jgi:hypothetical protein